MTTTPSLPLPLSRLSLELAPKTVGIPKQVKVTQWGTPLKEAKHVLFYFGGMPSSAEEPPRHSSMLQPLGRDVYAERKIHMVCIDKPGFGGSSFAYRFQIRRDWPCVVDMVAEKLNIKDDYSVMGVSNGGPYVMAALTHPEYSRRIKAGIMVVGVSDVWASGYFSYKTPSTLFEGLYNTLPIIVTGPLNVLAFGIGRAFLSFSGGYSSVFPNQPPQTKPVIQTLLRDSTNYCGLAAAVDCQQGLSPFYARKSKDVNATSVNQNADDAYSRISVPLSLWYGTQDSSVPMSSAEWLSQKVPQAELHKVDDGHDLYVYHTEQILDDWLSRLTKEDNTDPKSS